MNATGIRRHLPTLSLMLALLPGPALAQQASDAPGAPRSHTGALPDGQHDFDWEIGRWNTRLKRLVNPLAGSTRWAEYEGTTVVTKVWDGRANLVELDVTGTSGRIEALSLRLYNPETRQWSLNFSSSRGGILSPASIGQFRDGRGEFYSLETLEGRPILVRFIISGITRTSAHFEQAYSDDGGRTWEVNWVATDTLVSAPD